MTQAWLMIAVFLAGWLSTLSGVALGGWLVYRTKRDPYDPLFPSGSNTGSSFNIDDDLSQVEEESIPGMPKVTAKANTAFVQQFAEELATK
jgi:hypothetical protein